MAQTIDGLTWIEGTKKGRVEGVLSKKAQMWKEEEKLERDTEDRRRLGTGWTDDAMDIDEDGVVANSSDSDKDA